MPWTLLLLLDVSSDAPDPKILAQAEASFVLAYRDYAGGRLPEAILQFEAIHNRLPRDPIAASAAYNVAFLYSRLGKIDSSLDWLEKALAAGYDNLDHVQADGDLAAARQTARFAEILERARRRPRPSRPPVSSRRLPDLARLIVQAHQNQDHIGWMALASRLGWLSHEPTAQALDLEMRRRGVRLVRTDGGWTLQSD
jgi:tetratricopeptide (TPR) repeat protein